MGTPRCSRQGLAWQEDATDCTAEVGLFPSTASDRFVVDALPLHPFQWFQAAQAFCPPERIETGDPPTHPEEQAKPGKIGQDRTTPASVDQSPRASMATVERCFATGRLRGTAAGGGAFPTEGERNGKEKRTDAHTDPLPQACAELYRSVQRTSAVIIQTSSVPMVMYTGVGRMLYLAMGRSPTGQLPANSRLFCFAAPKARVGRACGEAHETEGNNPLA